MSEKKAYPLSWPDGWKRTPASQRKNGQFGASTYVSTGNGTGYSRKQPLTVAQAVTRVLNSLAAMGVRPDDCIVSTNLEPRLDGMPRSGQCKPQDPGAAVYWKRKGQQLSMAVDLYTDIEDNLAAISATIEATRTIKRHGGAEILDRTFQGFTALPERAGGKSWRDVLNFHATSKPSPGEITSRFRDMAKVRHPDAGGDRDSFEELIQARDQAISESASG